MKISTSNYEEQKNIQKCQSIKEFQINSVIGVGTFGKVYLAKWELNDKLVAIKNVFQNKRYKNRQLEILSSINHPTIVKLYHSFYEEGKDGTYLNLIMQYVPETLSKVLKTKLITKQFLPNESIKKYLYCILQSLVYLSERKIAHRDIKPSNILLANNSIAKICDFGSSKVLISGQKNLAYICSRFYRAPELIFGAIQYTSQIDIWSLGCVLAQMLTNQPLFEGSSNMNQLIKIMNILGSPTDDDFRGMKIQKPDTQILHIKGIGLQTKIKKTNQNADTQLMQLMKRMLQYDPQKRITPKQALKLSIFDGYQSLLKHKQQQ